jgi:hypothetical protein
MNILMEKVSVTNMIEAVEAAEVILSVVKTNLQVDLGKLTFKEMFNSKEKDMQNILHAFLNYEDYRSSLEKFIRELAEDSSPLKEGDDFLLERLNVIMHEVTKISKLKVLL